MNGREESENKIYERTVKRLVGLPQFVTTWYINLLASENTAATTYDYISLIRKFVLSQDIKSLSDINSTTTTRFIISSQKKDNGEPTSANTKVFTYRVLYIFEEYLVNNNMIPCNYVKAIRKPKPESREVRESKKVYLNEDDFNKMLAEAGGIFGNPRDYAILMLFMNTGMRLAALSNINIEDYDEDKHTVTIIDKGNKTHVYNLNKKTCEALDDYIIERYLDYKADTNALFVSSRGNRMSTKTIQRMVCNYAEKALGKHLYPHKLRGGFITIAYNKTHDINLVKEAVGHSSVRMTERYLASDHTAKQKVADIFEDILA